MFFRSIRATCPAHLILLDFTTRTILGRELRSLSSSLCNFLHSPVTSSLLGPNALLNTLFSNTRSLRPSLNVSDQVSHPYRTKGKIIVLYILIFKWNPQGLSRPVMGLIYVFNNIVFRAVCTRNTILLKSKAIPLQAWTGPEGSMRLRLLDFKTIGTLTW